jgi:hypothetical protein
MAQTYRSRRDWIEKSNEQPSVTEIVQQYKHFSSFDGLMVRRVAVFNNGYLDLRTELFYQNFNYFFFWFLDFGGIPKNAPQPF